VGIRGALHLAVRVPRQAVWKRSAPGASRAAPDDNIIAE